MVKRLLFCLSVIFSFSAYAQFPNSIAFTQLPSNGGMILDVVDYNNDGFEDVVYQNGLGGTLELYKNTNGVFSKVSIATQFPVISGFGDGSEGVVSFDYNNDGYQDLLIMRSGSSGYMRLFRNQCGKNFSEQSAKVNMPSTPGIIPQFSTKDPLVLIADYDKDLDLDIIYCRLSGGQNLLSVLEYNAGVFSAPIDLLTGFGSSIQPNIALIDYDNDRDEDLLLIRNTGVSNACSIDLFENNGSGNYSLITSPTGLSNSSPIGFANIFDFNKDGYLDILLGTKEVVSPGPGNLGVKVFRNNAGVGNFTDVTSSYNTNSSTTGDYFGSHVFDLNNDGDDDVLWEISRNTGGNTSIPALMSNDGLNTFTNLRAALIGAALTDTHTTAKYFVFDYNNDGALDIFQPGSINNPSARLFRNTNTASRYLTIRLLSCSGMADPIGTKVYIKAGSQRYYRYYGSQGISSTTTGKSERLYFGLPGALTIDTLEITWPDGNVQVMTNIATNQHLNIIDGTCSLGLPISIDLGQDSVLVCNSDTGYLSAPSGYATYSWSNGNNTADAKITRKGWVYCTVTNNSGCSAYDSVYVGFGIGRIQQNDTSICVGSSIQLDAYPRYDCSPFGAPLNTVVNAGDNLGPQLTYVNSLNGHHYYIFNANSNWTQAEFNAVNLGGHLVVINSQQEKDFLSAQPALANLNMWIGLYRQDASSPFHWVNCDPLTYQNWSAILGAPSSGVNDNYVYVRGQSCTPGTGEWKNIEDNVSSIDPCESTIFGLVEFDPLTNVTYNWSSGETTPSIVVGPTSLSFYNLSVTQGGNTCNWGMSVDVVDPNNLIPFDTLVECKATEVLVQAATGMLSYSWNTGSTKSNITVTNAGSGRWYRVFAVSPFGCSGVDSVYVVVQNTTILTPDTSVCSGTTFLLRGPVLPYEYKSGYTQNFQLLPLSEWSSSSTINYNGSKVLGPFANDSLTFSLPNLPTHDSISVSFDLFIHDTWEGNCSVVGQDRFKFKEGVRDLLNTTFSNSPSCTQAYSASGLPGSYPAKSGANATGLPRRCDVNGTTTRYRITKTFAHLSSTLDISFVGDLRDSVNNVSGCNESWSLDNVSINIRKPMDVMWSTGETSQNIYVTPVDFQTEYWVRVPYGSTSCYDTVLVTTYFGQAPIDLMPLDTLRICNAKSVSYSLPANYSFYAWSNGDFTANTTFYNEGWYTGYVETGTGCFGIDSIYVSPIRTSILPANDTTVCIGSPVVLSAHLNNDCSPFGAPASVAYTAAQAIAGYTYKGEYRGHHYYLANTRNSWSQSAQNALAAGGHLANINDQDEQNFIASVSDSNTWLGLYKGPGGYFVWMNCDTLTYANWASSEPSASPDNYVYMRKSTCVEAKRWDAHPDSDLGSPDPCANNIYGLLEIEPNYNHFSWSNGSTASSILIVANSDTTISLQSGKDQGTNPVWCNSGSRSIHVFPKPNASITGVKNVCEGDTASYTSTVENNCTYTWTVTGGTINTGQSTNKINVSWVNAGKGSVMLTVLNTLTGCSNTTPVDSVVINSLPSPLVSGLDTVCANTSATYTTPANTGRSYLWIVSGGVISSGQGTAAATITWGGVGTGTIQVKDSVNASGCKATSPLKNIIKNNLTSPTISGASLVCSNTGSVYTTPANVGRTYTWSVTGGAVLSGQGTATVTIFWGLAGSGTLTVTDSVNSSGCKATSIPFNVNINSKPTPVISGPGIVCSGVTSTYSTPFNSGRTYLWTVSGGTISSGQGTSSIQITWGAAGSGTIQVSDSNNLTTCKGSTVPYNVNINPSTTPVITGVNTVCESDISSYSVPFSSGSFYNWMIAGGIIVSGQGTSTISVLWSAGTGTIVVSDSVLTSGCVTYAAPFNVNVNPKPNPFIAGVNSGCAGSSADYSTPASTGHTYIWTVVGGTIVTGQGTPDINVLWGSAGTGYLMVLDSVNSTGCKSSSTSFPVAILNKPNAIISGANILCANSSGSYGTIYHPNRTYEWSVTNGTILSGQGTFNITVQWGLAGMGTIQLKDSMNGTGCFATAIKNITLNPVPNSFFTAYQSGGTVTFIPIQSGLTCKWYFGDGDSSAYPMPTHSYLNNGIYTVQLFARTASGCTNDSALDIDMQQVGLNPLTAQNQFEFSAQPNPFGSRTTLSFTLDEPAQVSMEVFDLTGRLIKKVLNDEKLFAGKFDFNFESDSEHTASAVYIVSLKVNDHYQFKRIVQTGK